MTVPSLRQESVDRNTPLPVFLPSLKGEGVYVLALLVHLVEEHNGVVGRAREVSPLSCFLLFAILQYLGKIQCCRISLAACYPLGTLIFSIVCGTFITGADSTGMTLSFD